MTRRLTWGLKRKSTESWLTNGGGLTQDPLSTVSPAKPFTTFERADCWMRLSAPDFAEGWTVEKLPQPAQPEDRP